MRGSIPCAYSENMIFGGNTSCFQIFSDTHKELLIVDSGTGLRTLGNHLVNQEDSLTGQIFITHPHGDHLQGFPFFKPFYKKSSTFRIYMPPLGQLGCNDILQGYLCNTFFPVAMDMFDADMYYETFEPGELLFDHYNVDFMWANHTIETAIYRFNIHGKKIIIAPDNELPQDNSSESQKFIQKFKAFVKDADVLIHDAQFNNAQYKECIGWGHSAWEHVLVVCANCNVKKLILTHHDPDSDDDYLETLDQKLVQNYFKNFESVFLAREGMVMEV